MQKVVENVESIAETTMTIANNTKLSKSWVIYNKQTMYICGRFFLKQDAEKKLRKIFRANPWNKRILALSKIDAMTEPEWKTWTLLLKGTNE